MSADDFRAAHGPYQHGKRWRVVLVGADGRRVVKSAPTRATAQAAIDALHIKTSGARSIRSAVADYLKACADRGLAPPSVERIEYHLEGLLELDANGDRPLTWLRHRGADLYDAARAGHATDTHRNALSNGKAFGRFCVKRRWLLADPFAEVEPVGRRRAGRDKEQLRVDEARKLTDLCLARCRPVVRPEPVAVLAAWLLGTRATELVVRDVRDLDDGGRLLVIPVGKNRRAARSFEIPEVLQPLLLALAAGRGGTEPLFLTSGRGARWRPGRATRYWLHYWCDKICRAAGVPSVAPHGLRRSHMSIARAAGATGELVAAQVGHGSVQVQERSYVAPGAAEKGRAARVLKLVQGGRR
jgi:integrase